MDDSHERDVLIVGQGLAGSLLAWNLERRGLRTLVIDENHHQSSSMVAAGLINPVTGIRLVKTHNLENCLPTALSTYRYLGKEFHQRFFHPRPMLRLFKSDRDQKLWRRKFSDTEYQQWIQEQFPPGDAPEQVLAPMGGFRQSHTGYVDLPALLKRLKGWLDAKSAYSSAKFNPDDCRMSNGAVQWRQYTAKRLVLCQGHSARHCPWFGYLPFQVVKGETLTLRAAHLDQRYIINRGHWLLPTADGDARFGASYDRENLNTDTTQKARDELLDALPHLVKNPRDFHIVRQAAGIRPATLDTQPFLGPHPTHSRLFIFNGFGSKGSLLVPWYAERFSEFLIGNESLPSDADVARYRNHFDRPCATAL